MKDPATKLQIIGIAQGDASVFGVQDLGGSAREWCGNLSADQPELLPIRGGSWGSYDTTFFRAASRVAILPNNNDSNVHNHDNDVNDNNKGNTI